MRDTDRILTLLLRAGSIVLMTAFGAVFLPRDWMAATHAWLGFGELPRDPVFFYLSRSIAALYGFHGVLLWIVANDVRGLGPIVRYLGWMNLVFGLLVLGIDLHVGMPWFWTWAEGPPVMGMGVAILFLSRQRGTR